MSDNEIVVSPDDRKVGSTDIELSPLHFASSTFSEIEATKSHTYAQKKRISLHSQLQDISYRIDLHEWLVENQCIRSFTQIHHNHSGGVFMDADGILRYENTWLPAEIEADNKIPKSGSSYLFQKTGCFEMALILRNTGSDGDVGHGDGCGDLESQQATMIRFLGDWEKLWSIFAENQSGSDFVRRHIPLLRIFISFFFHKRTAQTLIILNLYNLALFQVYHQLSGTATSIGTLISVEDSFLVIALYTAFYRLYKGSIWSMITLGLFDARFKFKSDDDKTAAAAAAAAPSPRVERAKSSANPNETGAMRKVLSVTYSVISSSTQPSNPTANTFGTG
eukprot:gene31315-41735_t